MRECCTMFFFMIASWQGLFILAYFASKLISGSVSPKLSRFLWTHSLQHLAPILASMDISTLETLQILSPNDWAELDLDATDKYRLRSVLGAKSSSKQSTLPNKHDIRGFVPGTLDISREESLRYCITDEFQAALIRRSAVRIYQVFTLDDYKLMYFPVPKAAQSTSRHLLLGELNGTANFWREVVWEKQQQYFKFTFVRDPVDRFISMYDELNLIPRKAEDMPYFQMPDNVDRLREFLRETENEWFDVHTYPQVWFLLQNDLMPINLDLIGLTTSYTADFKAALKAVGLGHLWANEELPRIRSKSLHWLRQKWNRTIWEPYNLPEDLQRRVCEVYKIDYCCLNLPLPPACQGHIFCKYHEEFLTQSDSGATPPPIKYRKISTTSTSVPPKPEENCFWKDIGLAGEDIEAEQVEDVLACQWACQKSTPCEFFTYRVEDHTCRMKRTKGKEWNGRNIVISGPKKCPS